jgi:hypothetical protein
LVEAAIAVCYADAFETVDLHEASFQDLEVAKNKYKRSIEEQSAEHPEMKERAADFLIER